MNKKLWTVAMIVPFAVGGMVATAPAASAKTIAAQASGQCSMGSHWKMKAKPDDGRMELELEVDSNRNGQRWAVRITNNRHLIFAGTKVTVAPSGSFEVARLTANRAGLDHFVGFASNPRTHEVCIARVNR